MDRLLIHCFLVNFGSTINWNGPTHVLEMSEICSAKLTRCLVKRMRQVGWKAVLWDGDLDRHLNLCVGHLVKSGWFFTTTNPILVPPRKHLGDIDPPITSQNVNRYGYKGLTVQVRVKTMASIVEYLIGHDPLVHDLVDEAIEAKVDLLPVLIGSDSRIKSDSLIASDTKATYYHIGLEFTIFKKESLQYVQITSSLDDLEALIKSLSCPQLISKLNKHKDRVMDHLEKLECLRIEAERKAQAALAAQLLLEQKRLEWEARKKLLGPRKRVSYVEPDENTFEWERTKENAPRQLNFKKIQLAPTFSPRPMPSRSMRSRALMTL